MPSYKKRGICKRRVPDIVIASVSYEMAAIVSKK